MNGSSEDDTFRVLKKVPFSELQARVAGLSADEVRESGIIEQLGWTVEEVTERCLVELSKLLKDMP